MPEKIKTQKIMQWYDDGLFYVYRSKYQKYILEWNILSLIKKKINKEINQEKKTLSKKENHWFINFPWDFKYKNN